jgi:hypothetical protein
LHAIRAIHEDGLSPADYHLAAIEMGIAARSSSPTASLDADLQLLLADAVATLVDHLRYGKVSSSTGP